MEVERIFIGIDDTLEKPVGGAVASGLTGVDVP